MLQTIATGNQSSSSRVLSVETFAGLDDIVKELTTLILNIVLEGESLIIMIQIERERERPTRFLMPSILGDPTFRLLPQSRFKL